MQIYKLVLLAPFFLVNQTPHLAPSKASQHVIKPKPVSIVKPVPTPPPVAPVAPPPPPAPPAPVTFPVAPPGTYANLYAFGNCTWYVAGRKNIPNSWGNAATWGLRATADGITVSPVPLVGAIAQRTGGLGHVAIVLEVSGGQVLITEMNSAGFDLVDERWEPISTYNYIYT